MLLLVHCAIVFLEFSIALTCIRCPPPGRGKRTATWDFSRLQMYRSSGIRDQQTGRKRPLCKDDFIQFYTNECPRYQRILAQRLAKQNTLTYTYH